MPKRRVLVVEDNLITSMLIEKLLTRSGFEVVGKHTFAEKALEEAQATGPDAIIMDVMLEGSMTGIEAADILKKERDIPIVFLTALSDKETLDRIEAFSNIRKMTKPFEERELIKNLEELLN
jgi:CheY-like chemotaxis protein